MLSVFLLGVALVALRFGLFSRRATGRVSLRFLGPETNVVDSGWKWVAFSITNGRSASFL
jgi:hypothetical protein